MEHSTNMCLHKRETATEKLTMCSLTLAMTVSSETNLSCEFGRQENCIWAVLSFSYQTRLVVAVVDFFANTSDVTRCVSAVVDFLASTSDVTRCVSAVVDFLTRTSDVTRCAVMTSYGIFPTSSIAL